MTPQKGKIHLVHLGVLTRLGEVLVLCVTSQGQFLEQKKLHRAAEKERIFSI